MARLKEKASLFFASLAFGALEKFRRLGHGAVKDMTEDPPGTIYDFEVKTIDGHIRKLTQYKGQVLLLVNTASLCGFTPQYEELESLHRRYRDRGLSVLAFPANEFGAQEPGSDAEIRDFCSARYSVSFELFSKIVVKGPGIHPLYDFLTRRSGHNGEISWNFTKFLVGREGAVAARFGPQAGPLSRAVTSQVESLLSA